MTGEDFVSLAIIGGRDGRGRLWRLKGRTDSRQFGGTAGVCQEAEVTDAAEPFRQHVEQETTNELIGGQRHHFGRVCALNEPAARDSRRGRYGVPTD